MKRRVAEMEEEARKLKEMQEQADLVGGSESNREEADARSVHVSNVCAPNILNRLIYNVWWWVGRLQRHS